MTIYFYKLLLILLIPCCFALLPNFPFMLNTYHRLHFSDSISVIDSTISEKSLLIANLTRKVSGFHPALWKIFINLISTQNTHQFGNSIFKNESY